MEIPVLLSTPYILLLFSTFSLFQKQQVSSNLPSPQRTTLYPEKNKALASQCEGQRRKQKDKLHLFANTYVNGMCMGSWTGNSSGPHHCTKDHHKTHLEPHPQIHLLNFAQMNTFKPNTCIKALLA